MKSKISILLISIICIVVSLSQYALAVGDGYSVNTGFDGSFNGDGTFADTGLIRVGKWGTANAHTQQFITIDNTDADNPVLKLATTSGLGGIRYTIPDEKADSSFKMNLSYKFKMRDTSYNLFSSLYNADAAVQNGSLQNNSQLSTSHIVFMEGGELKYGNGGDYGRNNPVSLGVIEADQWYTVTSVITVSGNSRIKASTVVLNEDGSVFGNYSDVTLSGSQVVSPAYFTIIGEKGVYIDDLKIDYNEDAGLYITECKAEKKAITLRFSMVLDAESEITDIKFKKVGSDKEIDALIEYVQASELKLSSDELEEGAEYEIIFSESGVTDVFGRYFNENVTFCTESDVNHVSKMRLIDLENSELIPQKTIENNIKGMVLRFKEEILEPDITLEAEDESVDVTVTGSDTEYNLAFSEFLKPGTEYTLTADFGAENPYVYSFTTTDNGVLEIKEFGLYKNDTKVTDLEGLSDGDTLVLKSLIYNTTGNVENVCISYGLYSNGYLKGVNFTKGELLGKITGDEISKAFTYKEDMELDEICGFLIRSMEEPEPMYFEPISIK